jgi:mRNA interferase YafQ
MLKVRFTHQMKRDYKLQKKRGKNPVLLENILEKLANRIPLESKHNDHPLSGGWVGYRECHIENDWLLIYTIDEGELILFASRTGTHADFGW